MRVAYCRVSTEEQARNETIENQRIAVRRACNQIDRIFEDDGESGAIPLDRRPGGHALLEEAKSGRVQELFVNTWDRLGRDLREFLNVLKKLEQFGVKVKCITQPTSDDPAGRLMRHVFGAFAQHERERILERTAAGFQRKASQGGYCGGFRPFGYGVEGQGSDARLALATERLPGLRLSPVDIVRRIFSKAAKGESCQKIADWLNAMNIPTSKQNRKGIWRPNSVRVIITNPIYTGTVRWGRRQWVKDEETGTKRQRMTPERAIEAPCPAIVDQEVWDQANVMLHQNQITAMAHGKTQYLLRALIRCGICGLKYTGRAAHYACIGRHCARRLYGNTRPPCPAPTIRRSDIESTVWEDIEDFASQPGAVVRQLKIEVEKGSDVSEDLAQLETQRKILNNASAVALRQLTRGVIDETQYDNEIESIKRDIQINARQSMELRKLAADQEARERALGEARSVLEELHDRLRGKLSFEQKRRAVEALVAEIVIAPSGQARIVYTFQPRAARRLSGWEQNGAPGQQLNATSYVPA